MAAARIDPHWRYHELRAILLENACLRLTVLPEVGAKIYDFICKRSDRNFLWQNPRLDPRLPVFGGNFDDWWSGGWDEVFPTCDVSTHKGETYPYLGELWSLPWSWEVEEAGPSAAGLYLTRTTIIAPARMEKWIRLEAEEPVVRFRHRLTNIGTQPMDFVWGLHPCFRIDAGYRIDAPARVGVIGHTATAPFGPVGTTYPWPNPEICTVPPASQGWCEGHYATDLSDGWVALTDPKAEVGIGLVFPRDVFPVLWCWMVYGGWRGHYHAALEPWTGWPHQLDKAVAAGRHRTLAPGESLECETMAVVYSGVQSVASIGWDGHVRGRKAKPMQPQMNTVRPPGRNQTASSQKRRSCTFVVAGGFIRELGDLRERSGPRTWPHAKPQRAQKILSAVRAATKQHLLKKEDRARL